MWVAQTWFYHALFGKLKSFKRSTHKSYLLIITMIDSSLQNTSRVLESVGMASFPDENPVFSKVFSIECILFSYRMG